MAGAGKKLSESAFEDWTEHELAIRMRMLYSECHRIASGINGTINILRLAGAEALELAYAEEYRIFEN